MSCCLSIEPVLCFSLSLTSPHLTHVQRCSPLVRVVPDGSCVERRDLNLIGVKSHPRTGEYSQSGTANRLGSEGFLGVPLDPGKCYAFFGKLGSLR